MRNHNQNKDYHFTFNRFCIFWVCTTLKSHIFRSTNFSYHQSSLENSFSNIEFIYEKDNFISTNFKTVPPAIKMNHFSGENPLDEECAQSWCRAKVQPWIAIRTHLFQARLWLWTFTKVFGSKVIYYWFVTRLDVQTILVNSYVSSVFLFIMKIWNFSYLLMYWKSYED